MVPTFHVYKVLHVHISYAVGPSTLCMSVLECPNRDNALSRGVSFSAFQLPLLQ